MVLTDEQINRTYQLIKKKLLDSVSKSDFKTVVFLGGQPGSGKSHLTEISINNLENNSAVIIDTDLIRKFHPNKKNTTDNNIYSLDIDCYKWCNMLIEDAKKESKNLIFDGTFGGDSVAIQQDTMKNLKECGYSVNLNLLATNDIVSKIGISYRYEMQLSKFNTGRPVDLEYHNKVYKNIPNNLMQTLSKSLVDEFNIYGRNHTTKNTILIGTFKAPELKINPIPAIVSYVNERSRCFTKQEVKELASWKNNTEKLVTSNNSNLVAFNKSMTSDDPSASIALKNQIKAIFDAKNSLDYRVKI